MTESMRIPRRTALQGLAGGTVAALLAGLPASAEGRPGVLKINTIGLDVSDFHRHTGSIGVVQVIAETLTSIDKDGGPIPFLAESWTVSDDGRSYRFTLRAGVKFHNGRLLTAKDIVANVQRIRDKVRGGWLTSTFKTIESMNAPDDRTFVLNLPRPFAPMLNLLAEMWVVAPESPGWDDTVTKPICTGPFVFETWQPQVRLYAPAFKDYWAVGLPKVAALEFDLNEVADPSLALRTGDYHIAGISVNKIETVERDPKTFVTYHHDTSWWFLSFNNRKPRPPFDNPRVREAILYAMDKGALAKVAGGASAIVSNQMVAPGNQLFDEAMQKADKHAKPNLALAKKILAEEKVDPSKVTMHVISSQDTRFISPVLQMLRQLGFQVDSRTYDDLGYQKALSVYDWDLFPGGSGPRVDPYLRYVRLMSDGPNPGLWGGIQDPELDALIRDAVAETNASTRRTLYLKAMQRALDRYYFIPFGHGRGAFGVRREVEGFLPGFTYSLHGPNYGVAPASLKA